MAAAAAAAVVASAARAIQRAVNCAELVLARRRTSDLHASSRPVGGTGIIWQVSRPDARSACDVWSTTINRVHRIHTGEFRRTVLMTGVDREIFARENDRMRGDDVYQELTSISCVRADVNICVRRTRCSTSNLFILIWLNLGKINVINV